MLPGMAHPEASLPEGFRRAPPLGAVLVGTPPVTVALLARQAATAPEGAAVRVLRVAHPQLDEQTLASALELIDREPATAALVVRPLDALNVALSQGLGTLLLAGGCLLAAGHLIQLGLGLIAGSPSGGSIMGTVLGLAAVLCSFGVGVGLVRLSAWARRGAAMLGGGLVLLQLARLITSESFDGWGLLTVGACCLLLLRSPSGSWFSEDGRATSRALPVPGYRIAVTWLALVIGALVFVVPSFHKMFAEIGVTLPLGTMLLLDASAVTNQYLSPLAPLAVILLPAPLLVLGPHHGRTVLLASWVLGIAAFGSILGWLVLPLIHLMQQL